MGKKENRATLSQDEMAEVLGSPSVRMAETLLRIMPMGLCLAALVVMLNNRQNNDFGSISYSDIGGFRYLVYANGICVGYSLLSAFYTAIPCSTTISRPWIVFFFDQVLTYVVLAAGAVSAELVYLAHKGDEKITWSAACGVYGGFCRKAVASVGITFGTVLCYIALSLLSSYRLFGTYDSPVCSSG